MTEGDPKTESIRIPNYPASLMGVDDEQETDYCKYIGCRFTGDGREVLEHIKQEHPLKEIECNRCHQKTRLEGQRWCEDCVDLCQPKQITP